MAKRKMESISNLQDNNQVVASHSFEWTISNYTSQTKEQLVSPSFFVGVNELVEWNLIAYPNGDGKIYEGYLSLYLHLISSYEYEASAQFTFSIFNDKEKIGHTISSRICKFCPRKKWGFGNFIPKEDLLNRIKDNQTANDEIRIICDIKVYGGNINKTSKICIHDHLQQILISKKYSDVTVVVGDKKFQAHKAILAARSPVFSAMFDHDMKESQTNEINIIDIDSKVLEEILYFIYTDNVKNLIEMAEDLLAAADKYQLERLKLMCEQVLRNKLNTSNAVKILVLADLHSSYKLKMIVIDFICQHAEDVGKTEEFKSMSKDLLIELFNALAKTGKLPSTELQN